MRWRLYGLIDNWSKGWASQIGPVFWAKIDPNSTAHLVLDPGCADKIYHESVTLPPDGDCPAPPNKRLSEKYWKLHGVAGALDSISSKNYCSTGDCLAIICQNLSKRPEAVTVLWTLVRTHDWQFCSAILHDCVRRQIYANKTKQTHMLTTWCCMRISVGISVGIFVRWNSD